MKQWFPGARILTERFFGCPKSYIAYAAEGLPGAET